MEKELKEKIDFILNMVSDIKSRIEKRDRYKMLLDAYYAKLNEDGTRDYDLYPDSKDVQTLEPIRNEIKLARKLLLELSQELK